MEVFIKKFQVLTKKDKDIHKYNVKIERHSVSNGYFILKEFYSELNMSSNPDVGFSSRLGL